MKRNHRIGAAVLLLLTAMMLASCSMVFYGGLSGKVMDKDNNGIADVRVFLYLDKEQWEADKALYVEGKSFNPTNFYKDTYSLENGNYAFDKVMWKTASSDFGTVADISDAYLIFYDDDWGMEAQTVTILSESKNTASPQIMDKKTETFTYRISLRDAADSSVPAASTWTLTYSYTGKPGEDGEAFTEDIIVRNASEIVIPVTYYSTSESVPKLTLSDIECTVTEKKGGEDVPVWKLADGQTLEFQGSKKTEENFTLKMDELSHETFTYRVNFRNAGATDKAASSRYTFKYSYEGRPDTEGVWTSDAVTVNGSTIDIPVTYYEGDAIPKITLSEVKCVETRTKDSAEKARWKTKGTEETFVFEAGTETTEKTVYMDMVEMWWQLPGFSGEVVDATGNPVKNAKVTVNDGSKDIVTRSVRTEYDNGNIVRASFSGLADDYVIWRNAEAEDEPISKEFTLKCTAKGYGAGFDEVKVTATSTDLGALSHIVIEGK